MRAPRARLVVPPLAAAGALGAHLLAAAAFAPTFKASGSTIDETFLDDTDSITAQKVIGEHFPAGSATPIQIVVPQADADAALQVVTSDPGVVAGLARTINDDAAGAHAWVPPKS